MPVGPIVNLTSANEHVPEIERRIRTVKEIIRDMRYSISFNRKPKLMMIHAVLNIGKMLNYFLTKSRESTTIIPKSILKVEKMDYEKHLRLQYGKYYQVNEN